MTVFLIGHTWELLGPNFNIDQEHWLNIHGVD